MELWHLQLFLFALLLPLVSCADPIYERCGQNFTGNYDLQNSIDRAISTVIRQTPSASFAIYINDENVIPIYGVSWCRGDISAQACTNCITATAKFLRASCPNSAASRVRNDLCFQRYETTDFLGNMDITDMTDRGTGENTEISKEFDSGKWKLLNWLMAGAASANNRFAMGKRSMTGDENTIFGMAQCTADLQEPTCMECLEAVARVIAEGCALKKGCHVMTSSCFLWYDIYNFILAAIIPDYQECAAAYAPAPSTLS